MAHLNSGRLNLSMLREIAREDLFSLLDSINDNKTMILDPKLIGPLGLISDYTSLKEHKIIQMLELNSGTLPPIKTNNLIYFIRPKLSFMDIIAENVKTEISKCSNLDYSIIFVPRKCMLCEKKLQSLGVYGDFTINEFSPGFYVLDSDLISIEWPLSFKECNLEMDYSSLYEIATSLMVLQCTFGIIPTVCVIGRYSKIIYDIMNRMRNELIGIETNVPVSIDQLILIDRSLDLISPTITQLTYEGLLDEIYGINQTTIRLPPEKFLSNNNENSSFSDINKMEPKSEMQRFYLNSGDELFKKLRDNFYLSVGSILHASAKSLAAQYDERNSAESVREIKQFVEKLPYLQKLKSLQSNHTSMAELIREFTDREEFHDLINAENEFLCCYETESINAFIETCISSSKNILTVIRLIVIQSFCANGLKPKTLDFYKREILQTYGYEHLLTLTALEKCGLIRVSNGYGISYSGLRARFKLTRNEKETNKNNNDDNQKFVHDVHVPLTSRIVQHIDQFGFRSFSDAFLRNVKIDSSNQIILSEEYQTSATNRRRNSDTTSLQSNEPNDKLVMVLFVGGCTFSEISSLRLLSHKDGVNSDYIIATTSIINGNTFIKSLSELTLN